MAVKLRFARFGCKNKPFYRVVAADSCAKRDGKHLEAVGFYNPLAGDNDPKRMSLKVERVKYWLSVGAQPSDSVKHLLIRSGVLTPPAMNTMGRKGGSQEMALMNPPNGGMMMPPPPQ